MTPATMRSVIRSLIKKYGGDPVHINSGDCHDFAEALLERMRKHDAYAAALVTAHDLCYVEYGAHSWVYYDGKHYDAEAPNGVSDWLKLPFFLRRCARPRRKMSRAKERERFETMVKFAEYGWRMIDAAIRERLTS